MKQPDDSNRYIKNRSSSSPACAACKLQRRKCRPDCPLAPHFPATKEEDFLAAQKLFGTKNILKNIKNCDSFVAQQDAVKSMVYQGKARVIDPVGGCHRMILRLQDKIRYSEMELQLVLQKLSFHKNLASGHDVQQLQPPHVSDRDTPFNLDDALPFQSIGCAPVSEEETSLIEENSQFLQLLHGITTQVGNEDTSCRQMQPPVPPDTPVNLDDALPSQFIGCAHVSGEETSAVEENSQILKLFDGITMQVGNEDTSCSQLQPPVPPDTSFNIPDALPFQSIGCAPASEEETSVVDENSHFLQLFDGITMKVGNEELSTSFRQSSGFNGFDTDTFMDFLAPEKQSVAVDVNESIQPLHGGFDESYNTIILDSRRVTDWSDEVELLEEGHRPIQQEEHNHQDDNNFL